MPAADGEQPQTASLNSPSVALPDAGHIPVMLREAMHALEPIAGGRFIDATLGMGGYTRELLARGAAAVTAFDADPHRLADLHATEDSVLRQGLDDRSLLGIHGNFRDMRELLAEHVAPYDGIVFDLGVSSRQLDDPLRGFSYRFDAPLDLRFDNSADSETAAELLQTIDYPNLVRILRSYGEEPGAARIARSVLRRRDEGDLRVLTTSGWVEVVHSCTPPMYRNATLSRCFQALRIAVNDELASLGSALDDLPHVLKTGARLAIVSFHSLEDRIAKHTLRPPTPNASRHMPEVAVPPRIWQEKHRKPILPTASECASNPRARSAKLRNATLMVSFCESVR